MVRRESVKRSSVCRGFITGSVRAPSLLVLDWSRARPKAPFSKERVPLLSNFFRSPVSSCVVGKSEVTRGRFLAELWIGVAKCSSHQLSQTEIASANPCSQHLSGNTSVFPINGQIRPAKRRRCFGCV